MDKKELEIWQLIGECWGIVVSQKNKVVSEVDAYHLISKKLEKIIKNIGGIK